MRAALFSLFIKLFFQVLPFLACEIFKNENFFQCFKINKTFYINFLEQVIYSTYRCHKTNWDTGRKTAAEFRSHNNISNKHIAAFGYISHQDFIFAVPAYDSVNPAALVLSTDL